MNPKPDSPLVKSLDMRVNDLFIDRISIKTRILSQHSPSTPSLRFMFISKGSRKSKDLGCDQSRVYGHVNFNSTRWCGTDPGFPQRGHQPKRGRQPIIWPNFAKNCMKMKKIGPGARPKIYYIDQPLRR